VSNNSNTSPDPILITLRDTARMLAVSTKTLYAMIERGDLQSVKIGKSRRIIARSIHELIDSD
jgi:excisionase family DNA binding protein